MEVLGFLGVVVGAIAAYFAARYVELQGARRRVYARYLAATDGVIGSLTRRMSEAAAGTPRIDLRDLPPTREVNEAIGELTIFASTRINRRAEAMQWGLVKLTRLAAIAPMPSQPAGVKWDELRARYYGIRREYIEQARRETGAWRRLPDDLFVNTEPPDSEWR